MAIPLRGNSNNTLVLGDEHDAGLYALPGAVDFMLALAARRVPFIVLTNGTVRTPSQNVVKLQAMGSHTRASQPTISCAVECGA